MTNEELDEAIAVRERIKVIKGQLERIAEVRRDIAETGLNPGGCNILGIETTRKHTVFVPIGMVVPILNQIDSEQLVSLDCLQERFAKIGAKKGKSKNE